MYIGGGFLCVEVKRVFEVSILKHETTLVLTISPAFSKRK
jgi:hypothetical protein